MILLFCSYNCYPNEEEVERLGQVSEVEVVTRLCLVWFLVVSFESASLYAIPKKASSWVRIAGQFLSTDFASS